MKRSTRVLLFAALTFLITGLALGLASLCAGFRYDEFRRAVAEGEFEIVGPAVWWANEIRWAEDSEGNMSGTAKPQADSGYEMEGGSGSMVPGKNSSAGIIGEHVDEYEGDHEETHADGYEGDHEEDHADEYEEDHEEEHVEKHEGEHSDHY